MDTRGGEQQHRLGEGGCVRALAREGHASAFRIPGESRKAGARRVRHQAHLASVADVEGGQKPQRHVPGQGQLHGFGM